MTDQSHIRGRGVQSVEVSVRLLAALAQNAGPMSLSDLGQALSMAPAKVHRYLASFVDTGMVRQRKTGLYDLGPLAAEIGIAAIARIDPVNRAADLLGGLVEQTGLSATLAVWGTHGPTVVRWEKSATPLVTTLGLGSVLPVTRSATGRVFLAHLPDRLLRDLVRSETGAADLREFDALRRDVRAAGVAIADQEFIPGLFAISCAVKDVQGGAAAVVTLVGTNRDILDPAHPARTALRAFCDR
ncbi:IclR family transcriptional regulator [Sulfitobacter sabulilitoris]|uniref:IclR family transcriptional regulator n=1 Tax=Sulfitobacter sabulilitoris TaxID=2562655 RepID=A0A5S3PCP2_9RHOB|nr:helix-turn-helix domain-containing protein [Sulfitobacter sabulilitoris]TMM50535.1 IclR family transcriptional regulator [Sulfitobacter sabulilitoris]